MLIILFDQDISFIIQSIEKLMRKPLHGYPILISNANEKQINNIGSELDSNTFSGGFRHLIKLGYSIGESFHIADLVFEFSPSFLTFTFWESQNHNHFLNNYMYIHVELIEKKC